MKNSNLYCLLLWIFLFAFSAEAQQNQAKVLEEKLSRTPADTNRVNLLHHLSYQYYIWGGDQERIKMYADECLQLSIKLHHTYGIALAYNALGRYYFKTNQNQQALMHFEKALKFYQLVGRKLGLAVIYRSIAMVNQDMGNFAKSMEYYLKSIRIGEEIQNQEIIGNTFQTIGLLMLDQKKYDDALCYLFQALSIHQKLKDDRSKAITLNAIGLVCQERRQYARALHYLNRSLRLSDSLDLPQIRVTSYNSLGAVLFFQKRYDHAFGYYEKALNLAAPQSYQKPMSIAMDGMADVYLKKNNTAEAIYYYQKSLEIAEAAELIKQKIEAHEGLMTAYATSGDYQRAYLHQSNVLSLKDSTFTKENDNKIAQLEASYEVEKKQAEIVLLHKDQQQAKLVRNAILAGLLASLVIIGLVVNRQRLKNRQNRLLFAKSEEITGKNIQLEQQAKQLQKLSQVKSNFFANISHEFRTPLTLILAPMEKLLTGNLESGQAKGYYQLIDRNARQLLHLINQLLDYSKLEAGSLKVKLIRGDVNQRMKATTFAFFSLAESKQIHLHFRSEFKSIQALFDPDLLDKILNNLLSNAFKFTPPEGHVTVSVALLNTPDAAQSPARQTNRSLEITVRDTGIGIQEKQLDQIFDRFFQVEGTQVVEQQGTGIGLALVKELVNLHNGTISVKSEVGQGTRFAVHLPLAECSFEIKQLVDQPKTESSFGWFKEQANGHFALPVLPLHVEQNNQKPLMLMVEDNAEVREFIGRSFLENFRVIEASDGVEGLKIAQKEIPDIIITDRMMPLIDGVEFCRQLKNDERTSHIPLIMLTAKASETSKIEGLKIGADDYILKPFNLLELKIRVENLIEQRKQLRERFTREVRLQPKDIAISSADEVFFQRAIRVIEEHMADTDFSVETFVSKVGMSRVQVHRKLKALTNQSTSEFIRSIRLKRAASLLEQHYGSIADVMYEVGFNNVSYFASNFKKMYGVNPSEYQPYATAQAERANSKSK
ncbi:tetratricopeptide repeat protein [Dyadobacter arcticus]|uniref:histidine kinase n=1 Tax=Dyadobacter arcticus TaxID=1078754 RepID=A0ABX0UP25_9BACT|nr:tetratricopeptide repeat protein [Dyadobacter arcticus]NIJ54743.1 signal transduction histidine kinase/DNA-binding response OmpR family regulator [Dyadobacter arcticus]